MKRRVVSNIGIMVFLSCTASSCATQALDLDLGHFGQDPAFEKYSEHLEVGLKLREQSNFADAIKEYEFALSADRGEVPNYEAKLLVADAQCASGQKSAGRSTLAEFRCMFEIDTGTRQCGVTSPIDEESEGTVCYTTMCGELFETYYGQSSPENSQRLAGLARMMESVESRCK